MRVITQAEAIMLRNSWLKKYYACGANVSLSNAMGSGWTRDEWRAMGAKYPGDYGYEPKPEPRPVTKTIEPDDDPEPPQAIGQADEEPAPPAYVRDLHELAKHDRDADELVAMAIEYIEESGDERPNWALQVAKIRLDFQRHNKALGFA
jgi:hypothetical protein